MGTGRSVTDLRTSMLTELIEMGNEVTRRSIEVGNASFENYVQNNARDPKDGKPEQFFEKRVS